MTLRSATASSLGTDLRSAGPVGCGSFKGRHLLLSCGLVAALVGACQAPPGKPSVAPAPARPSARQALNSNTDPCAMRLHDICGPLLLYYATHQQLPAHIEELAQVPGFEHVRDFTCPVSGRPYIYNPVGIVNSGAASRVVLYDPSPAHAGMRWAISIIEPKDGNSALISKVVALPEADFSLSMPPAKGDAKAK